MAETHNLDPIYKISARLYGNKKISKGLQPVELFNIVPNPFVLPFLFPGALKENQKVQKNLQKRLDRPQAIVWDHCGKSKRFCRFF